MEELNKKEQLGLVLMVLGILIGILMVYDVLSIIGDLLYTLFKVTIDVRMLNSFWFRVVGVIIGGCLLLSGGLIFKKNSQ